MLNFEPKKQARRLQKWLQRREFFDSDVRKINEILAEKLDAGITTYLGVLASWYGNAGNLAVLQGRSSGWEDLRRSFDYESMSIRIIAAYQDSGKYGWVGADDIASWLCFGLAFRLDAFSSWLGDRIISSLESKADKYRLGPLSAFYFAFIQFYALWRKKKFNVKDYCTASLGVYQEILDYWSDEKRYLKACVKACDYHVQQMRDEEGYPEFEGAPEDLLPVEILMIRRIREDQGLPTPEIDHPLMQTPLAHPPKHLPEVHDELLEKVIAKARAELPIGDPW